MCNQNVYLLSKPTWSEVLKTSRNITNKNPN